MVIAIGSILGKTIIQDLNGRAFIKQNPVFTIVVDVMVHHTQVFRVVRSHANHTTSIELAWFDLHILAVAYLYHISSAAQGCLGFDVGCFKVLKRHLGATVHNQHILASILPNKGAAIAIQRKIRQARKTDRAV